jgi:proteasome-associated ATPase
MPRPTHDQAAAWEALCNFGPQAPDAEQKLALLQQFRAEAESPRQADIALLDRLGSYHRAVLACRDRVQQLEALLERLTAPPMFLAIYLAPIPAPQGLRALVRHGGGDRLVSVAEGVDLQALRPGDTVLLSHELNSLLARAPDLPEAGGETCSFERATGDGRLVVKSRDEEFILHAARSLAGLALKPGDLLRWNRGLLLACERLERTRDSAFFVEGTPPETFAAIGGLDEQIEEIKSALTLHLHHRDVAARYQLPPRGSILLHGPSGTGKTLVAKALANWLGQIAPGHRSFFMNIKPAALHSMWYAQSEANYREIFRVARETAAAHPGAKVVMFFDEVDAIGAPRGSAHLRVQDNVLMAFLAELDGLAARGDVVVVGATNRREALDAALVRPGRLGDLMVLVPRPNREAGADILGKYLPPDIPYAQNGHGLDLAATRAELIDAAVSRIYAPNGDGALATLTFRDGRRQPVRPADLVSGAVIAHIARAALERACRRELESGEGGVRWEDLSLAITSAFETAARGLTPANCRHHLTGLPYDLDVVNIEVPVRKVRRPQRFFHCA